MCNVAFINIISKVFRSKVIISKVIISKVIISKVIISKVIISRVIISKVIISKVIKSKVIISKVIISKVTISKVIISKVFISNVIAPKISPDFVGLLALDTTTVARQPLDGDGKRLGVGHRDVPRRVRSRHFDAASINSCLSVETP